jgi:molybdate transport system substrate-binding protein
MLLAAPLFALACGDGPRDSFVDCRKRPVRIAAASSLREIVLALRDDLAGLEPPISVEVTFGASSTLARQLALGAPIDLFVSADAQIVDDLVERGLLDSDSKLEFARGQLTLVARADAFAENAGLSALESPKLRRIAIPANSVPLGRYARSWLSARGTLPQLDGRIVSTEHARATLAAVDAGHVDLAVVYLSDARLARNARVIAQIDASEHSPIRYVAALSTTTTATMSKAAADGADCPQFREALVALIGSTNRERLFAAGFLPVEDLLPTSRSSTTSSSRVSTR